jgi:hypothetical protein
VRQKVLIDWQSASPLTVTVILRCPPPLDVLALLDHTRSQIYYIVFRFLHTNPLLQNRRLTRVKSRTMGFHSPASTSIDSIPETWESDSHDEHGFGYPLRRMVPLENVQLGYEESLPGSLHALTRPGFYKMPASQSSSTSSHMFFV